MPPRKSSAPKKKTGKAVPTVSATQAALAEKMKMLKQLQSGTSSKPTVNKKRTSENEKKLAAVAAIWKKKQADAKAKAAAEERERVAALKAVSYTHLTLPTIA
eukprot:TRINITY_DN7492_c0_g1_i2.p2 TRINITY_DN7492_c0_g1~~TRINITY_DN7492_c0_g1_i2.p2  ORF type:complete len:103 (-),score=32.47 TRINITY_DN7492_c0_g1_i2:22-330(-)